MSIQKHDDIYQVYCDNCSEDFEEAHALDEFAEVIEALKDAQWLTRKEEDTGDWFHFCTRSCLEMEGTFDS